jgi:hypothetical protein
MKVHKRQTKREGPQSNRIALPFEKAVEGLLSVKPKPKKKAKKKQGKPEKK